MKRLIQFLTIFMFTLFLQAELVNINPDPSGEPWIVGGVSNLTEEQAEFVSQIQILPEPENWDVDKSFPPSVDNSTLQYFRPVFNQEGFGSCGQASGIGYTFTYEMNFKRNTSAAIDASIPQSEWYLQENSHNWYPPHFTYNFLNEGTYNQGSWFFEGWKIVKQMGIPDVHTYGGMWPTEIAEPYEDTIDYKLKNSRIWMNGYEKYKSGMLNRVLDFYYIPVNTPSGLNLLKQWMNDHCDGSDNGGLAVFAGGFPSWGANDEFNMVTVLGLPGEGAKYSVITHWGHDVANHAMTFVGYDDDFERDYDREIYIDNQGIEHVIPPSNYEWVWDSMTATLIKTTEKPMSEWEVGALIMVNSWGRSWGVGGKAYVPYRLLGLPFGQGGIYDYSNPGDGGIGVNSVFVMKAVESYPTLTAKTEIDYSVRSNLEYTVGVSNNLESTSPQNDYTFDLFKIRNGLVGMSGIGDVLEIGFDASMLLPYITKDVNTKFFFGVNSSLYTGEPQGSGCVNTFSLYYNLEESISLDTPAAIQPNASIWMSTYHTVTPEIFYVNYDTGDNTYDGLSPANPFKTISKAISASPPGSTVMLEGAFTLTDDLGVGNEGLKISKSLEIIGESPENTIIQGKVESDDRKLRVFTIEAVSVYTDICLKNVTIRNGEIEDNGGGIYLTGSGKVTLENCNIESNKSSTASGGGIYSKGPGNLILKNCEINNNNAEVDGGGIYASGITDASFNNCVIKSNLSYNGRGHAVYIYSKGNEKTYFDRCNISQNGLNYSSDPLLKVNGLSAVYFNSNGSSFEALTIDNSSFVNNYSKTSGGALTILQSVGEDNYFKIRNCTFSENNSANLIGHGIYVETGENNSTEINSCTITYNGNNYSSQGSAVYYRKNTRNWAFFEIKNSIMKNPGEKNFSSIGLNFTASPPQFSRSYTISSDTTIPLCLDPAAYNGCIEELITSYTREESGTLVHKVIAGSLAKDAIKKGTDTNNPYNGAPLLDQRGFGLWNQAKDIGAYESPYYWVDVADKKEYETIPNWKTELKIADQTEYNLAPEVEKWKWTDYMRAQTGGTIILAKESEIVREEGSVLKWNDGSIMDVNANSRIINGLDFVSGTNINVADNAQLSLQLTKATVPANASVTVGNNSKLILENGSNIILSDGLNVVSHENAELVVKNKAYLTSTGTIFAYSGDTGKWLGINCQGGSSVSLNDVSIIGAETAVYGTGTYKFDIDNSVFEDCTNGINLLGMQPGCSYKITHNTLTGTDNGWGIFITSSDGTFSRNAISHFNIGTYFVMSSPVVSKCDFSYNKYFGVVVSGHDALPQLMSTEDNQPFGAVNCTIQKNAYMSNSSLFPSAQIGISPTGSIYMRYNDIISSPNFYGISIAQKDLRDPDQIITIDAQLNNWGSDLVNDDYFFEHPQYVIDYDPIWSLADEENNSFNSYITQESRILTSAISLEAKDKLIPAIKLYEHIIKKYVDTPEYYVAMARLPYLYEQAELENNVLIAMYDEALNSDATTHKKFFKGKKVATHIKGERYDAAIAVAEEMKAEADFEEEVVLAEINIALATLLKEAEGKGNSSVENTTHLQELLTKLTGSERIETPAGISENSLPSEIQLYQNYPNPFNPVTQIRFDLVTTANVKLNVYNVNGQIVAELVNGVMNAGKHNIEFDGSKLNSGVYYYTLSTDSKNKTKKMVLTK